MKMLAATFCLAVSFLAPPTIPAAPVTFTPLERFGLQGYSVAIGDYDGDGRLDVAVSSGAGDLARLYGNVGSDSFAESRPFNTQAYSSTGTTWGDFNGDGRPDIVVLNSRHPDFVYWNAGAGTFVEQELESGSYQNTGISAADYDLDGYLDILCMNGSCARLLHNRAGTFQSVLRPDFGWRGGGGWADYDRDLYPDAALLGGLCVYRNLGNDSFQLKTNDLSDAYWTLAAGDYDNDAALDIACLSTGGASGNELYRNLGGVTFAKSARFDYGGRSCAWGDADNDGNLDLAIAATDGVKLYLGDGAGGFAKMDIAPWRDVVGIAWGDYDDDGDLDLVVADSAGPNHLLRNESNGSDFISVKLAGRGKIGYSNTTGIGTQAELHNRSGVLKGYREIGGGQGIYTCMDAPEAHFGAPAGDTFTVLVTWPASGIVDTIPNVIPPARLKVVENRRPGLFSLMSPAKGAEASRQPMLVWHKAVDPDGDVVTYDLWYGKDPTFATHTEVKGLADTTWTPSPLLDSATYFWKVLAIDREHRVISYRNHYTDTMAVDSLGAQTWCTEQDWYFNATAAGISEESGVRSEEITAPSLTVERNPTRGAVTVRCTLPAGESGTLDILDVTGRVVRSYVLPASDARSPHSLLLTPHCLPGVLFLRLSSSGRSVTAKVVKVE